MSNVYDFKLKRKNMGKRIPLVVASLEDFILAGNVIIEARKYLSDMTDAQRRTVMAASLMNGAWPKDSVIDITETMERMLADIKQSLPWWKRLYRKQ